MPVLRSSELMSKINFEKVILQLSAEILKMKRSDSQQDAKRCEEDLRNNNQQKSQHEQARHEAMSQQVY